MNCLSETAANEVLVAGVKTYVSNCGYFVSSVDFKLKIASFSIVNTYIPALHKNTNLSLHLPD